MGYVASDMEKKGKQSRRGEINREISASNTELTAALDLLQRELESINAQLREPSAQDVAGRMADLYDRYVRLAMDTALNKERRQGVAHAYNAIQREQEQLDEQVKAYQKYGGQVKQLQGKLDGLGVFARKEKKETAAQLERAQQNRAAARLELKSIFGVEPKDAGRKMKQLEKELAEVERENNALPSMAALQHEQGVVWEQYRQEYETAQDHPDAESILQHMAAHKPPRVKSITGGLAGIRAENKLRGTFPLGRPSEPEQERHRHDRGGMEL